MTNEVCYFLTICGSLESRRMVCLSVHVTYHVSNIPEMKISFIIAIALVSDMETVTLLAKPNMKHDTSTNAT